MSSKDTPTPPPYTFDPYNPHYNPELAAAGAEFPFDCAITGLVEITDGEIEFTPVPRLRKRRNGWTPETQRAFIDALSICGCISRAARAVGKTPASAYRLLEADGADSFAAAWDQAIARAVEALKLDSLDRSLNGAWVPVVRRGKIMSFEHRRSDRLAIALLSGRDHSVADRRERAESRRRYRLKLKMRDAIEAETKKLTEKLRAEHQAVLDRIEAERRDPSLRVCHRPPRIRSF